MQMKWKTSIGRIWAWFTVRAMIQWKGSPSQAQHRVFHTLIASAKHTAFGRDHHFDRITNYEEFKAQVPIRDYENLLPYTERVKQGEADVLWPGQPIYLCKTSGTTSGAKFIPITKESMPGHITSARNALLCFTAATGNASYMDGKMIQLQGSPALEEINGIPFGRLSGIVYNHIPSYLKSNRLPSYSTNCIEDWEEKVEAIVDETINQDLRLIAGIPIWIQGYFEKLQSRTGGKFIKDVFPNLDLIVHGGVNYRPYKKRLETLIGKQIHTIETYPASEGFIAYQDKQDEDGLLLVLNQGMFYEFIPANEFYNDNPTRTDLSGVKLGVNYVLILNTSAGLWGYNIGDTVKFVSLHPYKIVVTGRIKQFISAFGEHVIGEEVDAAMDQAIEQTGAEVIEFTVAPQIETDQGILPYHEWFVEFKSPPAELDKFASIIDEELQGRNPYYKDLIAGKILQPLRVSRIQKEGFAAYMKGIGKYGGQNKVPRLSNDRKIALGLQPYVK